MHEVVKGLHGVVKCDLNVCIGWTCVESLRTPAQP